MNNATFSTVEVLWTFFSQFSQWFGIPFVLLIIPAYIYKFSWTFEGFKPFEEILFDPILHLFRMVVRFYVTLAGFCLMMLVIGLFDAGTARDSNKKQEINHLAVSQIMSLQVEPPSRRADYIEYRCNSDAIRYLGQSNEERLEFNRYCQAEYGASEGRGYFCKGDEGTVVARNRAFCSFLDPIIHSPLFFLAAATMIPEAISWIAVNSFSILPVISSPVTYVLMVLMFWMLWKSTGILRRHFSYWFN